MPEIIPLLVRASRSYLLYFLKTNNPYTYSYTVLAWILALAVNTTHYDLTETLRLNTSSQGAKDLVAAILKGIENDPDFDLEVVNQLLEFGGENSWSEESVDIVDEAIGQLLLEDPDALTPPSCRSFNYQQWLDNTQVCATKNIRFNVKIGNPAEGVYESLNIRFTQPIYFTTPRFHNDLGNLTRGGGANLTAQALRATMNYMVALHIATGSSESQIRSIIMETLNLNMRLLMGSGASASIQPYAGIPAIPVANYETTFLGRDNCQN